MHSQVKAELWKFPDRQTGTGKMIDAYLNNREELDDAAVHLLYCANRWEKRYQHQALKASEKCRNGAKVPVHAAESRCWLLCNREQLWLLTDTHTPVLSSPLPRLSLAWTSAGARSVLTNKANIL